MVVIDMWILFGILLFLVCAITVILLLPVYIILKSDADDSFYLRFKFLNKLYGGEEDKDNGLFKTLKSATGISDLDKDTVKKDLKDNQLLKLLREDFPLVVDIVKELIGLFRRCTAKVFKLKIVCADPNAADAAIKYGLCTAAVYPLLGYLHSVIRIKPSGEEIDISCHFEGDSSFAFETVLVIRVYRLLGALIRIGIPKLKRMLKEKAAKGQKPA